jgi:hypothetical protein
MTDHVEQAAKEEYETATGGDWESASLTDRTFYYFSAHRIIASYLRSLSKEVNERREEKRFPSHANSRR